MIVDLLWFLLYFSLAIVATFSLLATPYLRLTSLGWLIAIWTIPLAGALFFILTVVKARRMRKRVVTKDTEDHSHSLAERLGLQYDFPAYARVFNHEVLRDDAFLETLVQSIENASKRIWISTYIFTGDAKAKVFDALEEAFVRGVDVRLIVDRYGSKLYLSSKRCPLRYKRQNFPCSVVYESRLKSLLYMEKRLHTKIALIDNEAIVGSHNIRDATLKAHPSFVKNVSLKFSGEVVDQVAKIFSEIWFANSNERLICHSVDYKGGERSGLHGRIIASDPIVRARYYHRYLSVLFSGARRRICIWMPYFIPPQAMRMTLIAASMIGLDVRVLLPEKTESWLVDNAQQLVIKELTDSGVQCAISARSF